MGASHILSGFVAGIPMPAAILDDKGRLRALNRAWENAARPGALVAPTDEVGRDHLHDLHDEKGFNRNAGKRLAECIEDVLAGHQDHVTFDYEIEQDHQKQQWSATITRIKVEGDTHALLVHRDHTRDREADKILRHSESLAMERERNRAMREDRRNLIQQAQQEGHGPMTPIRLQLHLLRNGTLGELNEKQAAALERIERNVNKWWKVQDDLINHLSGLEDDEQSIEGSDLGALLEEALRPFRERALISGIRLRIDRTDDPLPVRLPRRSFVQALLILLDHAIRATPAGGLVWVRLRHVDQDGEIVIQDQDPEVDPNSATALLKDDLDQDTPMRHGVRFAASVVQRAGGQATTHCSGAGRGLEVALTVPIA